MATAVGKNSYGQNIDANGQVIYEYGPDAGKTSQEVQAGATQQGGAGSSTSYDSKTGQAITTQTPNQIPQETQSQIEIQNNKARLAAEAESRRLASFNSMSSGMTQPTIAGGSGADEQAARDAAFARSKDAAGANASAALKALEDVMGGRGLRGSSIEANGMADVITGGQSMIGDQLRTQMINDANRRAQIADRDYAGAITQRGQNMQNTQSLLGLMTATGAY